MAPRSKPDAHRAIAHPVRGQILAAMADRVVSPSELAAELGRPLGTIAYHVRVLLDSGFIEAAGTSSVRGAIQHHYRVREAGNVSLRVELTHAEVASLTERIRALVEEALENARDGEPRREITVAVLDTSAAARP